MRRALVAAAALAVFGAAPPASAPVGLQSGPMLAWMSLREAGLWVQTRAAADVRVRVTPEGASAGRLTGAIRTAADRDHVAVFRLDGLEPGAAYRYEVLVGGRRVAGPLPFRTQPLWQWRTDPPEFTAMIGSCFYVNEERYDRPGRPYGSEFEILEAMAAAKPDLMVWMGDNLYLREADFFAPSSMRARYRHDRSLPALQPFLASTVHYATWDDHDYGPDNSDASFPLKDVALELFERYFPTAGGRGTADVRGAFHRFTWADVDFFLLDDRYHRKPNRWPAGPDKRMLGAAQMSWLKEGLLGSRAAFKVVVLGNQVLNPLSVNEGMNNFKVEQEELLDWIVSERINGVLFLSGDRHHTELLRVERKGGYPLYEFTSSSITAGVHDMGPDHPERESPMRVPGTLLLEHSFGMLRFSGPRTDRAVTLEARGKDGTVRWSRAIERSEIAFGAHDRE